VRKIISGALTPAGTLVAAARKDHFMSVRKVAAVAFAGVAIGSVAACSPAPAPSNAGTSPATSAPVNVGGTSDVNSAASTSQCASAPSALVGKVLQLSVGKVTATAEGPVTVCAYTGRYEVIVRYQTGETVTTFAQAQQSQASLHQSVGTVKGLGDAAYLARYTATSPASNTLGALKGDIAIFITSPASLDSESTLMKELLAKV
jgi:hypothetical protein